MTSIQNPFTVSGINTMAELNTKLTSSAKSIGTGVKDNNDITSTIIGSNLKATAGLLDTVASTAGYYVKMLGTANVGLNSVMDNLTMLKQTLTSLGTAEKVDAQLQTQYQNNVNSLMASLRNASFNGKLLFTGLVNSNVQVGESTNNTRNVALSDLYNLVVSKTTFATTEQNAINVAAAAITDVGANGADLANAIIKAFGNNDGNNGQDAANAIAKDNNKNNLIVQILAETASQAGEAARTKASTAGKSDAEVATAITTASREAVARVAQLFNDGAALGVNGTLNIIKSYTGNSSITLDDFTDAVMKSFVRADAGILNNDGTVNSAVRDQQLSALDEAIDTVTNALANATNLSSTLSSDISTMANSAATQKEAADDYLKTDYAAASSEFKTALLALQGAIAVLSQGFAVAQAALQLIQA